MANEEKRLFSTSKFCLQKNPPKSAPESLDSMRVIFYTGGIKKTLHVWTSGLEEKNYMCPEHTVRRESGIVQ